MLTAERICVGSAGESLGDGLGLEAPKEAQLDHWAARAATGAKSLVGESGQEELGGEL